LDRGWCVELAIIARVHPICASRREEIFGPVLSVLIYHDEDQSAAVANNFNEQVLEPFGLNTRTKNRAVRAA
jgi:acyl-CoA reductase-like NAD-dependent aldehyde dehydrogenase